MAAGVDQAAARHGIAYVDWSQQEFGIAAALSGDAAMQAAYQSGDPYLASFWRFLAEQGHGRLITHDGNALRRSWRRGSLLMRLTSWQATERMMGTASG